MEEYKRRHTIRDLFRKDASDNDYKGFLKILEYNGMDFGKYPVEEIMNLYIKYKDEINMK